MMKALLGRKGRENENSLNICCAWEEIGRRKSRYKGAKVWVLLKLSLHVSELSWTICYLARLFSLSW